MTATGSDSLSRKAISPPDIPPKKNRKSKPSYDRHLYKKRHLIENMFAKLKDRRRVATRYDRCVHTFMAAIHIVASFILYLKE
ncbi:transposase [Acetobacter sacchari]|uniref:Transposase n=1 Tax=Acetobacter sacchari TaxID=2661687 RepID=A0ABS3LXD8_9PROT|nr:transposase [Acetobacter sacchari]MBO1360565.1 transposase [Acetobacter sacchari]